MSTCLLSKITQTVTRRRSSAIETSHVTPLRSIRSGPSQLVLSLFPGIDLLGRGFEERGFSVVRGPDLIFGGDIAGFSVPAGRFDGVIGGSPCADFSRARRGSPSGIGVEMLGHFVRVVSEALPIWWLLENVPGCPDVSVPGYSHQRIDIDARDLGVEQRRLRHFQFGHCDGRLLSLPRPTLPRFGSGEPTAMASSSGRRSFAEFCELQGLPGSFDLPSFTLAAKYRAVGNGVHLQVARFLAYGVLVGLVPSRHFQLCGCGCARPVTGRQFAAGPACRKRMQRKRDARLRPRHGL